MLEQTLISNLNPYSGICSNTPELNPLPTCFNIVLDDCLFLNLGIGKAQNADDYVVWVNSSYKLQFSGSVLDLDGFEGDVSIIDSVFANNAVWYYSCDASINILNSYYTSD